MDLRIEMLTTSPSGYERGSLVIERPDGFDDDAYRQHANSAAEILRQVMNGEVDYRHRARDGSTVGMVVVDELVLDGEVDDIFQEFERTKDQLPSTWGRTHLVGNAVVA